MTRSVAVVAAAAIGLLLGLGGCHKDQGAGGVKDMGYDYDAAFVRDPLPTYCDLDGGMIPQPSPPGGTLDCPSDKNLPGCPCTTVGMTAPCWPGARAKRHIGRCQDGTTTCLAGTGEVAAPAWGSCEGFVPPDPAATSGYAACECFSEGQWKIANISPCFFSNTGGQPLGSGGAYSTVVNDMGVAGCYQSNGKFVLPPTDWSTDTLTVDCPGRYELCYTLKAGDPAHPQAGDCTLIQKCITADYTTANQVQNLPPLTAWGNTTDTACTLKFAQSGGYGEMTVSGSSVMCDQVNKTFNRITYCSVNCAPGSTEPSCQNCMQNASGVFTK